MRIEDGRIVESAVAARAGFLDRPTLVVLATSTTLIVASLAIVLIVFLN
jgi:hypothetical protein